MRKSCLYFMVFDASSQSVLAQATFYGRTDFATGSATLYVAIGDLNGDSIPDIAVTNDNSNSVSVLLNTTAIVASTSSFSEKSDFTTGSNPCSVSIGDLDGDCEPDLAVTNYVLNVNNTVSVLLNTTAAVASNFQGV